MRYAWNDDRIQLLKQLISEEKTAIEIAKALSCSAGAVRMAQTRYNIRRPAKKTRGRSYIESKRQLIDLSTRIRVLRGEEILDRKTQRAVFTDDQLTAWFNGVEGCDLFLRETLNIVLQDYQLQMVDKMLKHRRFIAMTGRQIGKGYVCACYCIWKSIVSPNSKILIISGGQRQSDNLFRRIYDFIGSSQDLFDTVEKSNMEVLRFRNGSEVYSLPSEGRIRGYTEVSDVLMDEVAEIPDYVLPAVTPMLMIKGGNLFMFSTPRGCNGLVWDCFNNPVFANMNFPSYVNKYADTKEIELAKQTMPAVEFQAEYEGKFMESVENYFPRPLIDSCSFDYGMKSFPEADKEYFCGVDWGRVHDSSVITIVSRDKEKNLKVENIIELQQKPFPIQEQHILKLHETYGFTKICVEQAGLSLGSCDVLKEKLGSVIELFQPTIDTKHKAYSKLKKNMESS